MPRDMIPLRPIEGATEYPLTVSDWIAIREFHCTMNAFPLPTRTGELAFISTFLSVPVIRRAA